MDLQSKVNQNKTKKEKNLQDMINPMKSLKINSFIDNNITQNQPFETSDYSVN